VTHICENLAIWENSRLGPPPWSCPKIIRKIIVPVDIVIGKIIGKIRCIIAKIIENK
jgi:hypothetical protein